MGFLWGIGTILAAMVLISTMVLGSYQSPRVEALNATAPAPNLPAGADPAQPADEPAAAPPAPVTVPAAGSGAVAIASFTRPAPVDQGGRLVRIRVEVEREMPVDAESVALQAANILQDERSWPGNQDNPVRFDFVGDQPHDLVIRVLTPSTTDKRCLPLKTLGQVSCSIGRNVNLNGIRWTAGVPDYAGDLNGYRTYLINHEVGHYLGHNHVSCPGPGKPAPVMMQQTKGLKGCTRNIWP